MKRNSTRSYWMSNEQWYRIVDGKFELKPEAPEEARRSFAEWNRPEHMTGKRLLRMIRSKL